MVCAKFQAVLLIMALAVPGAPVSAQAMRPADKIIGMYVHQHWPYRHPYAARTWTLEDWRGYIDGLQKLGYNTVLIWPVLETMPNPLTPSDKASLDRIAKVIDMLHERGMLAYVAMCPNIVADNAVAGQATFEQRHFFHCDLRVNPADRLAVERMMTWREQLLRPLAKMDGVTIIDSDPAGYPHSTNAEFAMLLAEHRKVLDRLRPGIELDYWMWAGWPAYGRYYATGEFKWGTSEEFADILDRLVKLDLEPWGLSCGVQWAKNAGLSDRVWNFPYGAIEGEPSFPLTIFGTDAAYKGGTDAAPRGVMGNAQTHCVQLPNTFAFARGAQGKPVTEADYVKFADDLIVGKGEKIVQAWKMLNGKDPVAMRAMADRLEAMEQGPLPTGPLAGLLFGDPKRFINDLVLQLRYQAAFIALSRAIEHHNQRRTSITLAEYLTALEAWHAQHGYENFWGSAANVLAKLQASQIAEVLDPVLVATTPFGRVKEDFYRKELFTERLMAAICKVIIERPTKAPPARGPSSGFAFKTRGIYFHDGFEADPRSLAPLHWDLEQWRREIDWLASCRIDTVEFATMMAFSRIPTTDAEKRRIADRLDLMKHARSHKMKIGYLLSNTTVSALPDNAEPGRQVGGGAKDLCPRVPGNFEKTIAIQKWYMNTYKDVDFFEEFAGDWGGCKCGQCRPADYLRYVKILADEAARLNPQARLYANTWCISSWGPNLMPRGWRALFDQEIVGSRQVMAALPGLHTNVGIALPCHHVYRPLVFSVYGGKAYTPVFPTLGEVQVLRRDERQVLAWPHFVMDDDPARPQAWGIVHSEVRYIRDLLQRLRELEIDEVICNLYLPTLQLSNTYAYGRLLDNPDDDPAAVLRGFAGLIAIPEDVDKLADVMTWVENNSFWHQQMPPDGRAVPLPCKLDRTQARALVSQIRPNPAPARPLPIAPEEWLKQLAPSIDRMTWAK